MPCQLNIIEITKSKFKIGEFKILADYVCHPGPTVGYRIVLNKTVLAYIPDQELVLGSSAFPNEPKWTSGYTICKDADLLLHDAQYSSIEYLNRIGWGHSSMNDAMKFGELANVKKMLLFHHDPTNNDLQLEQLFNDAKMMESPKFEVELAMEGQTYNF